MDSNRFDRLAQRVGMAPSRRSVLGLAAAAVVAWLTGDAGLPAEDASAKRGAKERRRGKDAGQRPGRRHEKGAPRTRQDARGGASPARSDRQSRGAAGGDDKGPPASGPSCALQVYDKKKPGSRFDGPRKMQHDVAFFDELDKVNGCAAGAGVYLETGSSYRDAEKNKQVNPKSTSSNHIAGHALDFKFLVPKPGATYSYGNPGAYDRWDWIDITTCKKISPRGTDCSRGLGPLSQPEAQYPQPIREFIECVRQTPGITWGGDHPTCCGGQFDPIHVDDRLNESNRKAYTQVKEYRDRVDAVVASGPCPAGTTCDMKTGQCVQPCDPPCTDGRECRNEKCECPGSLADCDGVCTNTTDNNAHCGACGNDCTASEETCCGNQCIDTKTDLDHCGACGELCFGDACCDTTCVLLQHTDEHCGACGNDCTLEACGMCDEGSCASCADGETEGYECCQGRCRAVCADDQTRNPDTCACMDPECVEDGDCGDPCRVCVTNRCQPKTCGECQICQGGACVPKPAEAGACTGSNGSCYTTPGRCGAAGGCYCRQAAAGSGKCGNVCVGYLYTCRRTCAECPSGFRNCIKMGCCQSNGEQWVGCASSCANP